MKRHNGNCVRDAALYDCRHCGKDNLCDVCHEHDAPRGECKRCGPCPACAAAEPGKELK